MKTLDRIARELSYKIYKNLLKKEHADQHIIPHLRSHNWGLYSNFQQGNKVSKKNNLRKHLLSLPRVWSQSLMRIVVDLEKNYPKYQLSFGEVLECEKRNSLFSRNMEDPRTLQQILFYENSRGILCFQNKKLQNSHEFQFDLLLNFEGISLEHKKIQKEEIWKGLAASYQLGRALNTSNLESRLSIIQKTAEFAPNILFLQEHLAYTLRLLGDTQQALDLAKRVHEKKETAKLLHILFLLTNSNFYTKRMEEVYGKNMLTLFAI